MKKIILLFISAAFIIPCLAQEGKSAKEKRKEERKLRVSAIAKQEEEGIIKYTKHTAAGLKLTSDGYGGFVEVSRAQTISKAMLFQLDIAERKHQKEIKQTNPNDLFGTSSPIIYGKRNFFYPIKLGVQKQFLLGNKGNKNGVSVSGNAGGGFIVGLLRPYLVEVPSNSSNGTDFVKYDPNVPDSASVFLNGPFIGGPNFGTGWDQLKVTPGAYLKTALRFDFGKYNEMVNAVEVGLTGEFYSKKIPQMVNNPEKQFFFSAFVAVIIGKRK